MPHVTEPTDAPVPTTPKLRFDGRKVRPNAPDEYDALAELFLGDQAQNPTHNQPHTPTPNLTSACPPIDLLLLGNLPVRASVWPPEYARTLASQAGKPIALITVDDSTICLDMFGCPPIGITSKPNTIETAIDAVRRIASRIVVVLPQGDLTEQLTATNPDELTLLTGANSTAIVGAYQLLKGAAAAQNDLQSTTNVRVAFAGESPDAAAAACEKLCQTVQSQLNVSLELAAILPKVTASSSMNLYRGSSVCETEQLIALLRNPPGKDSSSQEALNISTHTPCNTPPIPSTPEPNCPASEPTPPTLHSHLTGLTPLVAQCPDDPETQIAVDESGHLHLLRLDTDGFERLKVTAAWASKHAALLALTVHDAQAVNPHVPPSIHLFTAQPKRVRHLLDAKVKLHILAQVTTQSGDIAWYCQELNYPPPQLTPPQLPTFQKSNSRSSIRKDLRNLRTRIEVNQRAIDAQGLHPWALIVVYDPTAPAGSLSCAKTGMGSSPGLE